MTVDLDLITGVALGIEYVEPIVDEYTGEEFPATLIVDLLILRFIIQW